MKLGIIVDHGLYNVSRSGATEKSPILPLVQFFKIATKSHFLQYVQINFIVVKLNVVADFCCQYCFLFRSSVIYSFFNTYHKDISHTGTTVHLKATFFQLSSSASFLNPQQSSFLDALLASGSLVHSYGFPVEIVDPTLLRRG